MYLAARQLSELPRLDAKFIYLTMLPQRVERQQTTAASGGEPKDTTPPLPPDEIEHMIACSYNNLDPENPTIVPGDKLIVPGGVKPYVARQVTAYNGPVPKDAKKGTGVFVWPTTGRITDRFGFRTMSGRWHNGLDIAGPQGRAVRAADSGFVTFAGWHGSGYGNLVIVDHRNGFVTYYAHLSTYYVSAGQSVGKGAQIAATGSTGNSSGPHLHFEIRYNGARKNPEMYLP